MKKITPKNYQSIIKELKEKNVMVYTERGKRIPATKAKFTLYKTVDGGYTISAKVK